MWSRKRGGEDTTNRMKDKAGTAGLSRKRQSRRAKKIK